MDGWKRFKKNDETQLYNDFSQCQKHYGLVASLLLPYATKIRWLEDSLIAVGASDLQASLNEIQCPRDVKPGSQAGYNGRGWTMVKKKLCLKVISSNEHRRYNSPSITRTLLEKRLQLNKSWTDRLKRPVLRRVSTYPAGDRIFWTYQESTNISINSGQYLTNP